MMNFGGIATPERWLIFNINDFGETLPATWEWDMKRLVASLVLAARSNGLSDKYGQNAAIACARSYRQQMRNFASMDILEIWYARLRLDDDNVFELPAEYRARLKKRIAKATSGSSSALVFPKLVEGSSEQFRIRDSPSTIFHPADSREARHMDIVRD